MPRIEKTVFISYRRINLPWALCIYQYLTSHGYDVFFDFQSIDSGNFEKVIIENIKARAHFLVVLTPSALERLKEPGDWLRREIEMAMDEKRNIVPLMLESFDFGNPLAVQALTGKLSALKEYNGLRIYSEYFFEAMDKLRERYLTVALSDIALPSVNIEAKGITEEQKTAASEAPQVEKEELSAQEWFERGYVFQNDKNLNEALRCYSEAIKLDPNLDGAHNNLGNVFSDLKLYVEAEAAYRKVIEIDPSDAMAYSNLGYTLRDLKRYDESEAACRKAIELDPSYAMAYANLGNTLHDMKRYAEAETNYRQAIKLEPSEATNYYNLGIFFYDLERYNEAEVASRKAIELNPLYSHAYSNLGNTLRDLKRYDESEGAYRKAIELNSTESFAYYNLGSLLYTLKRFHEAEEAYRQAIAKDPNFSQAYSGLSLMLRKIRHEQDAIPLLEKLITLTPDDFDPYLALISIQKHLGEKPSEEYLTKTRALLPKDNWYNLACLESVCGNLDIAFDNLLKAALEDGFNREWAWEDPDFEWLRPDPRFEKIVGPRP